MEHSVETRESSHGWFDHWEDMSSNLRLHYSVVKHSRRVDRLSFLLENLNLAHLALLALNCECTLLCALCPVSTYAYSGSAWLALGFFPGTQELSSLHRLLLSGVQMTKECAAARRSAGYLRHLSNAAEWRSLRPVRPAASDFKERGRNIDFIRFPIRILISWPTAINCKEKG